MFRVPIIIALLIAPLQAQIYADFTVSSGGTSLGTFRVLLEHSKAPRTCANFIGLASGKRPWIDVTNGAVRTNTPYYDGLTFHRLIHNFVIQGGSPNGQGTDGPGYSILDEYHPDLRHSGTYVLSMAKGAYPNTGGSQFFITLAATPDLNDKHSVFGTVVSGTAIIDGFKNATNYPTGAGNKPLTPIVMDSVVISGPDYAGFDIDNAALRLPFVGGTEMQITRDTAAATMTAIFDRKPKTDYMFLQSPDLSTWGTPKFILSLDAENAQSLAITSRPESSYFLNLATVRYNPISNAPSDLITGGKTLRLKFVGGEYIDLIFDGLGGGTWHNSSDARTGTLTNTVWQDQADETGVQETSFSISFAIPLGALGVTLVDYISPGSPLRLETWLSFHTETSGWLEELEGGAVNRFAFEILPN